MRRKNLIGKHGKDASPVSVKVRLYVLNVTVFMVIRICDKEVGLENLLQTLAFQTVFSF